MEDIFNFRDIPQKGASFEMMRLSVDLFLKFSKTIRPLDFRMILSPTAQDREQCLLKRTAVYVHEQNMSLEFLPLEDGRCTVSFYAISPPSEHVVQNHYLELTYPSCSVSVPSSRITVGWFNRLVELAWTPLACALPRSSFRGTIESRQVVDPSKAISWLVQSLLIGPDEFRPCKETFKKKVKDRVVWYNEQDPRRRSPCWQALKIHLVRAFGKQMAKDVLLHFLSHVLMLQYEGISTDQAYCGVAKLCCRMEKMGSNISTLTRESCEAVMLKVRGYLEACCQAEVAEHKRVFRCELLAPLHDQQMCFDIQPRANSRGEGIGESIQCKSISVPTLYRLHRLERAVWDCTLRGEYVSDALWNEYMVVLKPVGMYSNDPLGYSRLVLTSLAMLRSFHMRACEECPQLQSHCIGHIKQEFFDSLLLQTREEREVLVILEDYFKKFSEKTGKCVLEDNQFAISYASRNSHMKETRLEILRKAASLWERRKQEIVEEQRELYKKSQNMHERCIEAVCEKCRNYRAVVRAFIQTYEWPLPKDESSQWVVVFELEPPEHFATFRDRLFFVLVEILYGCTRVSVKGRWSTYCGLSDLGFRGSSKWAVSLYSSIKSSYRSHYSNSEIWELPVDSFLLQNRMTTLLYGDGVNGVVGLFCHHARLPEKVTLELNGPYRQLQAFMRPEHVQNNVIASQSRMSSSMTLTEYNEFGTILSGDLISLYGLLRCVEARFLDFSNENVVQLGRQVVYRAGSRGRVSEGWWRDLLKPLRNRGFCERVCVMLRELLDEYKHSWQNFNVLAIITDMCWLMSEVFDDNDGESLYVGLLRFVLEIAQKWSQEIRCCLGKCLEQCRPKGEIDEIRKFLVSVSLEGVLAALVHIDSESILHYLTMITTLLDQGWDNTCKNWSSRRVVELFAKKEARIHEALTPSILGSFFTVCTGRFAGASLEHSREQTWYAISDGIVTLSVNIISGELLVDGYPRNRLPGVLKCDPQVEVLFPDTVLEVYRSVASGYDDSFTSKYPLYESSFQFLWRGNLTIMQQHCGVSYTFLPSSLLGEGFPYAFIHNFSHWFRTDGTLEFRSNRFDPSTKCYVWDKDRSVRRVRQSNGFEVLGGEVLVCNSDFSKLFEKIEEQQHIHVWKADENRTEVHLPRYGLEFEWNGVEFRSQQYPGYRVCFEDHTGVFTRLQTKLVLENADGGQTIIVPNGTVEVAPCGRQYCIPVGDENVDSQQWFEYRLDRALRCLRTTSGREAWIYLAYLHGATASAMPEPFLGVSGIVACIDILESQCVADEPYSQQELDLLRQISELSPVRQFYPKKAKAMEQIEWPKVPVSATAACDVYAVLVSRLFKRHNEMASFYPEDCVEKPRKLETELQLNVKAALEPGIYEFWKRNWNCLGKSSISWPEISISDRGMRLLAGPNQIMISREEVRDALFKTQNTYCRENECRRYGLKLFEDFELEKDFVWLCDRAVTADSEEFQHLVAFIDWSFSGESDDDPLIYLRFLIAVSENQEIAKCLGSLDRIMASSHSSFPMRRAKNRFLEILTYNFPDDINDYIQCCPKVKAWIKLVDHALKYRKFSEDEFQRKGSEARDRFCERRKNRCWLPEWRKQYSKLCSEVPSWVEWNRSRWMFRVEFLKLLTSVLPDKFTNLYKRPTVNFFACTMDTGVYFPPAASIDGDDVFTAEMDGPLPGEPCSWEQLLTFFVRDTDLVATTRHKLGLLSSPITPLHILRRGLCTGRRDEVFTVVRNWAIGIRPPAASETGEPAFDPNLQPHWLALQLVLDKQIRHQQARIAQHMLSPRSQMVTQLHMGKGKTSVILPMLVLEIANGARIPRLIVPRQLLRPVFDEMHWKMGMLGRPCLQIPFMRSAPIDNNDTCLGLQAMLSDCLERRGVLISDSESPKSFDLQMVEHKSQRMQSVDTWMVKHVVDVLDESDEVLHVRNQLVYPMGEPLPLPGCPTRYKACGILLEALVDIVGEEYAHESMHGEIVYEPPLCPGWFPEEFRVSNIECGQYLKREALLRTLDSPRLEIPVLGTMPTCEKESIADAVLGEGCPSERQDRRLTDLIYTLRGLLTFDVAFGCLAKRYRVSYGLDMRGSVLVAVPYRAKDCPSEKSVYSHPDTAICLTYLAWYFHGLTRPQFETALERLLAMQNPAWEYRQWTESVQDDERVIPLKSLNRFDQAQIYSLYLMFQKNIRVVTFYIETFVLPSAAKGFSNKISASAWTTARDTKYPMVGFSGTNDTKALLPLGVTQDDMDFVRSTNDRMDRLLVSEVRGLCRVTGSNALSDAIRGLQPEFTVFIDVGAAVKLKNEQFALRWLAGSPDHIKAVVYFDGDRPRVKDRTTDRGDLLNISPYSQNLSNCLVYIDQIHARGTDLAFPLGTHACVTVGKGLTRDQLAQGVMRLRKLGMGHTFSYAIMDDVYQELEHMPGGDGVSAFTVLEWTKENNKRAMRDGALIWALQGHSYRRRSEDGFEFIEEEQLCLRNLYGQVRRQVLVDRVIELVPDATDELLQLCESKSISQDLALDREQECELQREIEEEQEVELPPPVKPWVPTLRDEVKLLVDGVLRAEAFRREWPETNCPVFTSHEYNTVLASGTPVSLTSSDAFRRWPIWWVFIREPRTYVAISPFEANALLPLFSKRDPMQTNSYLCMSAMRMYRNQSICMTEPMLTIPIGCTDAHTIHPGVLAFLGNLYFQPGEETALCEFAGLRPRPHNAVEEEMHSNGTICIDMFVPPAVRPQLGMEPAGFSVSPVDQLLAVLQRQGRGQLVRGSDLGNLLLRGRQTVDRISDDTDQCCNQTLASGAG